MARLGKGKAAGFHSCADGFASRARRTSGQGAADCGEYRQAAGAVAEGVGVNTDTAFA